MGGCQVNNGKISWAYTPSSCAGKELTEDQARDHLIATGETINTGTWWSLIACGGSSVAAILLYFLGGRSSNEGLSKLGHIGIFGALVSAGSAAYFYVTRISPDTNGDNSVEKGKAVVKDINQQLINLGKDNQDPTSRTLAAHELGNSNNLDAAAPLKNVLLDTTDTKEVRSQSAISLGKLGAFGAIDDLINCLSDPEASVRIGAIQALGLLAEKDANKASKALAPLKDFFEKTQSNEEKCWAVLALSKFPFHQVKDILLKDENLNHADTNLRQSIILSLATILQKSNDSEVIKALASRLEVESEPAICEIIINSFKNITDTNKQKETVHALCKFLERNTEEDLQESVIELLGKFNASDAIDSILEYGLKNQSGSVRLAALKALRQICLNNPGNPKLVDVVNALRKIEKIASGNAKKAISTIIKEIVTANPSLFTKRSPAPTSTTSGQPPQSNASSVLNQDDEEDSALDLSLSDDEDNSSVSSGQDSDSEFELSLDGDDDDSKVSLGLDSDDDSEIEFDLNAGNEDDSQVSSSPDSEVELNLNDDEAGSSVSSEPDDEVELALDAEPTSSSVDDGEPLSNSDLDEEPVPVVTASVPKTKPLSPIELLKDKDINVVIQAAKDCVGLGLEAIDPLLGQGLAHSDDKVKLAIISALVEICSKNLDNPKMQEISNGIKNVGNSSTNNDVKAAGVKAANDLMVECSIKIFTNDPSIQPKATPVTEENKEVFAALSDSDPDKAIKAVESCTKIGLAAIEPLLKIGLNHQNENVKIAVIKALGEICQKYPLAKEVSPVLTKLEPIERSYTYYRLADEAKTARECIQSAIRNKLGSAVQILIDARYTSEPPCKDPRIFQLIFNGIRNAYSNQDIARAIAERFAGVNIKTTDKECINELRLLVAELKRATINDSGSYGGYSSQRTKERAITNIEQAINEHTRNQQAASQAQQVQDQSASISQRKRALEQLFAARYINRAATDDTKDVAGIHSQLIECLEGKHGQELQQEVVKILGDPYTRIPTKIYGRSHRSFLLDASIAKELCQMLETLRNVTGNINGKDNAIKKLEDFVKAYTTEKVNDIINSNGKKGTVWTQEGLVNNISNGLNNLSSLHPMISTEVKKALFEKLKNIAFGIEKENGNMFCLSARKAALDTLIKAGFTFETIPVEVLDIINPAQKTPKALEIEFYKTLLGMSPSGSDEAVTLTHQFLKAMGLPRDASRTSSIFLAIQNHESGRTYDLERLVLSSCPRKTIDTRDLQGESGILKSIADYCQYGYSWGAQGRPSIHTLLQALNESESGIHGRLETIINGFVTENNKSAGTPAQLAVKGLLASGEYDELKNDELFDAITLGMNGNFTKLDELIDNFSRSNSLTVNKGEIRNELIGSCNSFRDRSNREKLKEHLKSKYNGIKSPLDPSTVKSDVIKAFKNLKQKHNPDTVKEDLLDAYKTLVTELQKTNNELRIQLINTGAKCPTLDVKFVACLISCASDDNEIPRVKEAAKQALSGIDADKLKTFDEKTKERIQEITGRADLIAAKPVPVQHSAGTTPIVAPTGTSKEQTSPTPKKVVDTPKVKQTPQEFMMNIINSQKTQWDVVVKCNDIFDAHKDGKSGFDREVTRIAYFILSNLARSDNNDSRSRTNAVGIIKEIVKSGKHLHLEETPMEYIRHEVSKEQTHQGLVNKYVELYNLHKDGDTVFDTEVCMLAYTSLSNFASGNLMYADVKPTNDDINAARLHARKQLEQIQNPPTKVKNSPSEYIKEVASNQNTHRDLADKYLELYKTHMNKDSDFDREVCAISYEALISFASGSLTKSNAYWIPDSLELPEGMRAEDKARIMTEKITEKRTAREYTAKQLLQIQPPAKKIENIEHLRKALISTLDPSDVRSNIITIAAKNNMPIDVDDLVFCICTKEISLSSYKPPETEQDKRIERENDRHLQEACPGITFKKELNEIEFQGGDYKSVSVKATNDPKVRLKAIELLIDRVENGSIPASEILKETSLGPIPVFKTKRNSLGQEKKVSVMEEGFISLTRTVSKQDEPEEIRLKILDLLGVVFKKFETTEPETVSTILKCLEQEVTKADNSNAIKTKCRNLLDTLAQKASVPTKAKESVA